MKIAIAQIKRFGSPISFDYDYDLMANIDRVDLLGCQKCHVSGDVRQIGTSTRYMVKISFDLLLTFECAISLEEVEYPLQFSEEIYFDYEYLDDDDDCYLIERDTIDLDRAVLSEIVLNLPYRVVKDEYLSEDED